MLAIVSTPSPSRSQYSCRLPALYPIMGPSNTIRKFTHHTRYAYYYFQLSKLKDIIILAGILYFPVMFLLNAGAAVVSAVGFVSTISFSLRISMLQFEWLSI